MMKNILVLLLFLQTQYNIAQQFSLLEDAPLQVYLETNPPSQGFLIGKSPYFEYVVAPYRDLDDIDPTNGKITVKLNPNLKSEAVDIDTWDSVNKLIFLKLERKIIIGNNNLNIKDLAPRRMYVKAIDSNAQMTVYIKTISQIEGDTVFFKKKHRNYPINGFMPGSTIYDKENFIGIINYSENDKKGVPFISKSKFYEIITSFLNYKYPVKLIDLEEINNQLRTAIRAKFGGVHMYFGGLKKYLKDIKTIRYGFEPNKLVINLDSYFIENKSEYQLPTPNHSRVYFQVETIDGQKGDVIALNTRARSQKKRTTNLTAAYSLIFKCKRINSILQYEQLNSRIKQRLKKTVPCITCYMVNSWSNTELRQNNLTFSQVKKISNQIKKIRYKTTNSEEFDVYKMPINNNSEEKKLWVVQFKEDTKRVIFQLLFNNESNSPMFVEYVKN